MKKGLTLVEMLIVVALFTVLFSAILTVMTSSDNVWRIGQEKLTTQQSARIAMDNIARLLRQSSPEWVIGGVHYPVTITGSSRIDFYEPVFDAEGQITDLEKVTFKLNPSDNSQLLRKIGTDPYVVVVGNIRSIVFGGGCAGCAAVNCSTVSSNCSLVDIQITTQKNSSFTLGSRIELRNINSTLNDDVEVEQPEEGEF